MPSLPRILLPSALLFFALPATASPLRTTGEVSCAVSISSTNETFELLGTVAYCERIQGGRIVIQDRSGTLYLWNNSNTFPVRGDKIRLSGTIDVNPKTGPFANCRTITVLGHDEPVLPPRLTKELIRANTEDNLLVHATGTVMDAFYDDIDAEWLFLVLNCRDFVLCTATRRPAKNEPDLAACIGATATIPGIYIRNPSARLLAILHFDSFDSIALSSRTPSDPFDARNVRGLSFSDPNNNTLFERRKAVGHVIAAWDGDKILVRTADAGIVKAEVLEQELPVFGQSVQIVGHPETDLHNVILVHSTWKPFEGTSLAEEHPIDVSARDLVSDAKGRHRYAFDLHGKTIRLTGIIRGISTNPSQRRLVYLESEGEIALVDTPIPADATEDISIGCEITATGVCVMEAEKMSLSRVFPRVNGFRIVPRRPEDIQVISRPPWWTYPRLLAVIGILVLILIGIVIWNRLLNMLVERKSRELYRSQIAKAKSEQRIDERTRLAAELHDYTVQSLTAVSYQISAAQNTLSPADGNARKYLMTAAQMLKSCRTNLRRCLWDLRNDVLNEKDFAIAIQRTTDPVAGDATVRIRFAGRRAQLEDTTAHAILSILRELVSNASIHGQATLITIAGESRQGLIRFSVRDNGIGFDSKLRQGQDHGHFGLDGILERLERLKGTLSIRTSPGKGTYVRFTIGNKSDDSISK